MGKAYTLTGFISIGIIDNIIAIFDIGGLMKKICILTNDRHGLPSTTGMIELFDIATNLWETKFPEKPPLFEVSVVSQNPGTSGFCKGVSVELTQGLEPYEQADAVYISGFTYSDLDLLFNKADQSKVSADWVRRQYENGAIISASCSGTVILAETGLLNGKKATTSWWLDGFFQARYPKIDLHINQTIVDEGRLITSGAVSSYQNLGLRIIEKYAGKELALACSKVMLIDYNKQFQAPFMMLEFILNHSDSMVSKAQLMINKKYREKLELAGLASSLAVSYRTFIRRFKAATGNTPSQYLQKVRIEAAKRLFEKSNLPLESVMERVGYSDPSSFSLLFKRLTRLTPKEYRQQFSISAGEN